jgi:hypothetical protein
MRSLVARWCVIVGFSAVMFGCSGASWQRVTVSPSYHAPKQLKVAVVTQGNSEHTAEALQAMQAALAEGLASSGITATFVAAPDEGLATNLTVTEWDQGVRALRWLFGFGAGEASIVVLVKSPSADGQPGVEGTARGWIRSGWFGGSSYDAATAAGHLIAASIANGQKD